MKNCKRSVLLVMFVISLNSFFLGASNPRGTDRGLGYRNALGHEEEDVFGGLSEQELLLQFQLMEEAQRHKQERSQLDRDAALARSMSSYSNEADRLAKYKSLTPRSQVEEDAALARTLGSTQHETERLAEYRQSAMSSLSPQSAYVVNDEQALVALLKKDIAQNYPFIHGNLTWCNCSNAPDNERLELAATIARDAVKFLSHKNTLNIVSFGTGGVEKIGGENTFLLLQEFCVIDALAWAWQSHKPLKIILTLIGPDLSEEQRVLLTRFANNHFIHTIKKNISLDVIMFNNHFDYIKYVQREPLLKSDIIYEVDTGLYFPTHGSARYKTTNCIELSTTVESVPIRIGFVALLDLSTLGQNVTGPGSIQAFVYLGERYPVGEEFYTFLNDSIQKFIAFDTNEAMTSRISRLAQTIINSDELKLRFNIKGNAYINMHLALKELIINTMEPTRKPLVYRLSFDEMNKILDSNYFSEKLVDPSRLFFTTPTLGDYRGFGRWQLTRIIK